MEPGRGRGVLGGLDGGQDRGARPDTPAADGCAPSPERPVVRPAADPQTE